MNGFWFFLLYSFCGFLLEKGYALLTGHPKRDRKCLLLLPLCPVYGLGALAVLALSGGGPPLRVAAAGLLGGTGAELLLGLFYRHTLGVEFWSYQNAPGQLWGLICLPFSLVWAGLALALVYAVHPLTAAVVARIPGWAGPPAAIFTGCDLLVSAAALRRTRSTEVLRWWRA